jgi:hypothetical protein
MVERRGQPGVGKNHTRGRGCGAETSASGCLERYGRRATRRDPGVRLGRCRFGNGLKGRWSLPIGRRRRRAPPPGSRGLAPAAVPRDPPHRRRHTPPPVPTWRVLDRADSRRCPPLYPQTCPLLGMAAWTNSPPDTGSRSGRSAGRWVRSASSARVPPPFRHRRCRRGV